MVRTDSEGFQRESEKHGVAGEAVSVCPCFGVKERVQEVDGVGPPAELHWGRLAEARTGRS